MNLARQGALKSARRGQAASSSSTSGQGGVGAESLDQPGESVAPGSAAARAPDADDGVRIAGEGDGAEAAHCARSTVAEAIKALEDAGVLGIKRVRERCSDLFGEGFRIVPARTSNGYCFNDPSPAGQPIPPKSENQSGTPNQGFSSLLGAAFGGERTARSGRKEAPRREGGRWSAAQKASDAAGA